MRTAVLLLAAGRGERLGYDIPKAFVPLAGRTLIEHALCTLDEAPGVDVIQPVVSLDALDRYEALDLSAISATKLRSAVPGGVERQDSVALGLAALPGDIDLVAVHDAARCLVRPEDVGRVIAVAAECGAALLAMPARDTIKRVRGDKVVETPPRAECWVAQTPQVFRSELLREAIEKAQADCVLGTDDAQLVERLGVEISVVRGSARNFKITHPEDLILAERLLAGGQVGVQVGVKEGGP
jgi:2-C-methyl-D-erythritol 4-phosphate cytidylyltransferase